MRFLSCIAVMAIILTTVPTWAQADHTDPTQFHYGSKENIPGLILEYERAISILNQGGYKGWTTSSQFLDAFDNANRQGTSGEPLTAEWQSVRRAMEISLPSGSKTTQIWDEHLPYYIAVQQKTLTRFRSTLSELIAKDMLAPSKPAS